MKKSVAIIVSEVDYAPSFEWIASSNLAKDFDLHFLLIRKQRSQLERNLQTYPVNVVPINLGGKFSYPSIVFFLIRYFRKNNIQVVHTHLWLANLLGLTAAWLACVPKRIFTRHHVAKYPQRSLRETFFDQLSIRLASKIVATCQNVADALGEEGVPKERLTIIRFGYPGEWGKAVSDDRKRAIQQKYHLADRAPVVGVISRYIPCKSIPIIIEAFQGFLRKNPQAILVLANASPGEDSAAIQAKLASLPKDSYVEIPFEIDVEGLYSCFQYFVHCPSDPRSEAFGQVYVEAMLVKIPAVFSLSGVAKEVVQDRKNAYVVPYQDSQAIEMAIEYLHTHPRERQAMADCAEQEARAQFSLVQMTNGLRQEYQ